MTAEQMVQQFLRHRQITQQFCDLMPDAHFGFQAYPGGMTFAALALHLATAADFYLSAAEGVPFQRPDPAALPQAPAAIRSHLADRTAAQVRRIAGLGDDLDRLVAFRDKQVPLGILLGQMREHEAHHKGQMMMMLRMVGVRDELFYAVR